MCAPRRHFGEPPAAISGAPGGVRGAAAAITGAPGGGGGPGRGWGRDRSPGSRKKKSFNYLILLLKATLVFSDLFFLFVFSCSGIFFVSTLSGCPELGLRTVGKKLMEAKRRRRRGAALPLPLPLLLG